MFVAPKRLICPPVFKDDLGDARDSEDSPVQGSRNSKWAASECVAVG
jgi:hypothetical protein